MKSKNNKSKLEELERLENPPIYDDMIFIRGLNKLNVFYKNKQGDLQRVFTLLLFMFFIYTLFLSVLPGEKNVLCFVSGLNECTGVNGDGSTALCSAYGNCNGGPAWSIGGESSPTTCCGDDSVDNVVNERQFPSGNPNGVAWIVASTRCCNSGYDVLNGDETCVAGQGSGFTAVLAGPGGASYTGDDRYATPITWGYASPNPSSWLDCDRGDGTTFCPNICPTFIYEGESAASLPGEYTDGATDCCGDDYDEYVRTFTDYNTATLGSMDWGSSMAVCCNAADQIGVSSVCFTSGTGGNAVATGATGSDYYAYPYTTGWLDLDGYYTWPSPFGSNVCGGSAFIYFGEETGYMESCGGAGGTRCAEGGFSNSYGCCGDDAGENYRTRLGSTDAPTGYTTDAAVKLCCNAADCIAGTTCTATTGTSGAAPTKAYCSAGTWLGGDDSQTACDAIVGSGKYLSYTDSGTGYGCCGDDLTADDFDDSTPSAGESCCLNGAILTDGATSGAFICSDGALYSCDSSGTYAWDDDYTSGTDCGAIEGKYCQSGATWGALLGDGCACTADASCTNYCDAENTANEGLSGSEGDNLVCFSAASCASGSNCGSEDGDCQVDAGADASCDDYSDSSCAGSTGYCDTACAFTSDGDASSDTCGCLGDTWIAAGTGGQNSKCCGDDTTNDDFASGVNGATGCCDGALLTDDTFCNGGASYYFWQVDGAYCSSDVYDSGSTSGTTVSGDDITCGCDATGADSTAPNICDGTTDSSGVATGVCVDNDGDGGGSTFSCDTGDVCDDGTYFADSCTDCATDTACDSDVSDGSHGYVRDGTCTTDNNCCSSTEGEVSYGASKIDTDPDDSCSATPTVGMTCDNDPSDGVTLEGISTTADDCCTGATYFAFGSSATDSTPWESCGTTCTDGMTCYDVGDIGSGLADSEAGICTGASVCTVGLVSLTGGNYVDGCASGNECDSEVATDGYVRDGYCAQTTCATSVIVASTTGTDECGTGTATCTAANFVDGDEDFQCDTTNEAAICSTGITSGDPPSATGICVEDTCQVATTVIRVNCGTTSCLNTELTDANMVVSCDQTSGDSCDSSLDTTGFAQDGTCAANACDTSGHVCFDDTNYQAACSSCGMTEADNDACDTTVTGGDYTANGMCTSGGVCTTSDVCSDGTTLHDAMSSCGEGDTCDSTGGTAYSADGEVFINDGSSLCCDATEDYEDTGGSNCCYNGAVMTDGTSSSSLLCESGLFYDCGTQVTTSPDGDSNDADCQLRGSKYCDTDTNTWIDTIPTDCSGCSAGTDCEEGVCIEGMCTSACDAGYDGDRCSDDGSAYDNSASGTCSRNSASAWSCDKDEVSYYSSDYFTDCDQSTGDGETCDSDVAPAFSQDGQCTSGTCCTTELVNAGSECDCDDNDVTSEIACDNTVTSGVYSADGICVNDGAGTADSDSNCVTSGVVCVDSGNSNRYTSGGSFCVDLDACDQSLTSANYVQDGIICSGSCVGSASSDCCTNDDCAVGYTCGSYTCADVTAPSCSVDSITDENSFSYVSGTEIFYNTISTGSFTVTVLSSDSGSGVHNVTFPVTVSAGGVDTSSTYTNAYSWTTGDTYSSTATVTCFDDDRNSDTDTFDVTRDITAPGSGSITFTDGYYTSTSVAITYTTGTDAGSGLNTSNGRILRQSATLSDGSCGGYGSWSEIVEESDGSYTDTTVSSGNCYVYRYEIFDNVMNGVNYTSASEAMVDTTTPTCTVLAINQTVGGGYQYVSGKILYYNTLGSGNYTINISSASTVAGIHNITYPDTTGTGIVDTLSPYYHEYNFSTDDIFDNNATIFCYANSGRVSNTSVNITQDITAPSGGSISYTDGFATTSQITFGDGSDSESGVNASNTRLFRRDATILDNNTCGNFGSWSQIESDDPTSAYTDATVSAGNCYQYIYEVFDYVSNGVNYSSGNSIIINNKPTLDQPTITSSLPSRVSNLTCSWNNVADIDGNDIVNITNWYKNGESLTLLNMPFEGLSGNEANNATDYSGYGNNGTVIGAIYNRTGGVVGGAYEFDGSKIIVADNNYLEQLKEITMNLWVKPGISHDGIFFRKENDYLFRLTSADKLLCRLYLDGGWSTSSVSTGAINVGEWNHVACSWDGSTIKYYINGVQDDTTISASGTMPNSATELNIGFYSTQEFNGTLDSAKIYNHTLSPEQIRAEYQAGLAGMSSSQISHNETSYGDEWTCEVFVNDGYEEGGNSTADAVTITNNAPNAPTLITPTEGNSTVHDRSPFFDWNSTDVDGDSLTYYLNITFDSVTACGADIFATINSNVSNYTATYDWCLDEQIFWQVRAFDGVENSSWGDLWNFTIESFISLNLTTNSVDFGDMTPFSSKNTDDDGIPPLIVENNGNILINISKIGANGSMFARQALNTIYFQIKADNKTTEDDAFNVSNSTNSWTNITDITIANLTIIKFLNYNDTKDNAEIDIKVTIPADEPPGSKKATLYIVGVPG